MIPIKSHHLGRNKIASIESSIRGPKGILPTRFVPDCRNSSAVAEGSTSWSTSKTLRRSNIEYPVAFSLGYLTPVVRLEIGPLASFVPRGRFMIRPYTAEVFPGSFADSNCPVVAIKAERTFWEKATILHQQAHRTRKMPPRYSRHYYDVFKLSMSNVKDNALADLPLLEDVVRFKTRFYTCPWANYEDARPGTFKLVPQKGHISALQRDYADHGGNVLRRGSRIRPDIGNPEPTGERDQNRLPHKI